MNYSQVMEYLDSVDKTRGINLGLERIERLLSELGNPHHDMQVIHVAGTNGKGSVCAMIYSILKDAGYKAGLYTSPHLSRFTERIIIDDEEIPKEEVVKLFRQIKPLIKNCTYFEIVTAMAFMYFKKNNVDFIVAEVGMGGRLDATNLVKPLVSVITNVSLEHTEYLGNTVEEIAAEKAGIIKYDSYVVTGAASPALEVIKVICAQRNSRLFIAKPTGLKLGLRGEFQKTNAGIAIKAIKVLKYHNIYIPKINIIKGLAKAEWPRRLEFLEDNLLVDCAHNPAGISCLVEELKDIKYNNLILIIGILSTKNYREMLDAIAPLASSIIISRPDNPKAEEPKRLARATGRECLIIDNVNNAIKKAKSIAGKGDLILVTGSIYLIGTIRKDISRE